MAGEEEEMMTGTRRAVILPNGKRADEIEITYQGNCETQASFRYTTFLGFPIDKKSFETDYWGRIEGLTFI